MGLGFDFNLPVGIVAKINFTLFDDRETHPFPLRAVGV